jgi:aryl-alcohol dehydrogenase-like predicted oxidoreductase
LVDGGVVRASNFSLRRWRAAECRLGSPVVSNQVDYNLVARKPERELLGYAASSDRLVIAYSPLAKGLLGCRYDDRHRPSSMVRKVSPLFMAENLRRTGPLLDVLREVDRRPRCEPGAGGWRGSSAAPTRSSSPGPGPSSNSSPMSPPPTST